MEQTLILQAFKSEEYKLIETDEAVEIPIVVLKADQVMTPSVNGEGKKVKFSQKAVEKIAKNLKGKPVLQEHFETISNIVGVVSDAQVKDSLLIANIKIPKTEQKLISLVKLKPSPINQFSIGGYIKAYSQEENILTIEDFETKEISIVLKGASPSTKRLDAKNQEGGIKMQEEMKELLKKVAKLEAQLEEKEKQIKDLKAQLETKEKENKQLKAQMEEKELETYRNEKLSTLDPALQAVAKPAVAIANTKEEIDKIIAEYKKLTASQTGFNPPEPQQQKNENPFEIL